MSFDLELADFRSAEERLRGIIYRTPLSRSNTFSSLSGNEVYLKYENAQKTGSYKIRGASNKLARMVENGDRSDVVAASAGNHAQGVANAASSLGLRATVVMPKSAPIAKVQATENYGARVILYGDGYDEAYRKACEICETEGARFIHPFDDPDVIAGQGTIAAEILSDLPDADAVIVPAGGGGLLAGISCALKHLNPHIQVYGVQSEHADAIARSFAAGKKVVTDSASTIADGIAVKVPGDLTLELIRRYADGVVTVKDDTIAEAVLLLLERSKQVVEPAGAAAVAAVLEGKIELRNKKVVCLLSGGNIDVSLIGHLIERALTLRTRRGELHAVLPERADAIIRFMDDLAAEGVKVLDFQSDRSSPLLGCDEVRVYALCEFGGAAHKETAMRNLRAKGYAKNLISTDELMAAWKDRAASN